MTPSPDQERELERRLPSLAQALRVNVEWYVDFWDFVGWCAEGEHEEGYEVGHENGTEEGYSDGYDRGYEDCETGRDHNKNL